MVDGAVTEYHMAGDLIASETSNGKTMWYIYDSGANLLAVNIDGKYYTYVRNIQNDIIALVDASGKTVVNYAYDSWGKLLSITGSLKDTVGVQNPFRYRGYYYDNETGMYYLKNRYYDPELRRFISADKYVIGTDSILPNMYMYCGNNPVNNHDENGHLFKKIMSGIKKFGSCIEKGVRKVCTTVSNGVKTGISICSSCYSGFWSVRRKMSIKPIIDNIQVVLELVVIGIFIIRIYVKKKKQLPVKKYNRAIIICGICWFVLESSMQLISFPTLESAIAFQGQNMSETEMIYGENSALVVGIKDGTTAFDVFGQERGRWKMSNYVFSGVTECSMDCENTRDYMIVMERHKLSGGVYIMVIDYSSTYQEEKTILDSEGTHFDSICASSSENGNRMYFGYMEDVPKSYEVMVNKEELKFDWEWAFEFLT